MVLPHRACALLIAVACAAPALVGPGKAVATQPTTAQLAQARATYQTGLALEAAGDWKAALVKFREVAVVKTTPQVLFHIARCLEHLGRWTEALGTYRMAVEHAQDTKATPVLREADEARAALEGRIPRLRIVLGKRALTARVSVDGVEVGATAIGKEMPADPGPHRVVATVDGDEVFASDVVLREGALQVVTVALPEPASSLPAAGRPVKPKAIGPTSRTGWIFLGAGTGALFVGGAFLVLRQNTIDELERSCVGAHCPEWASATSDRGKAYTMLANGFLAVGAISTGVGIIVLSQGEEQSPTEPAPVPSARLMLSSGAPSGGPGATLWGQF